MASDTNDKKPPETIGPYEVRKPPQRGGMGDFYEAVDPATGQAVAVKVLSGKVGRDEQWSAQFEKAFEALKRLEHPNLVRILDYGRDEARLYYVMELVPDASSLAARLSRRRMSLGEALKVIKSICLGLEDAHRQEVFHGNLSPRNILVSDDLSVVKITAFGLSRLDALSSDMTTMATTEASLGAVQYAAPELAKGKGEANARSDIYSAGVMLYEMLTARVPVGRFSLPSQVDSGVPPLVDPIVLKCLATDPTDRYADARQLYKDISNLEEKLQMGLVEELRGFSRSTSRILLRSTSPLRQRWFRMALAVAGVAALAILAVALWMRGEPEPSADEALAVTRAEKTPAIDEDRPAEEPPAPAPELSQPPPPAEPEPEESAPSEQASTTAPAEQIPSEEPVGQAIEEKPQVEASAEELREQKRREDLQEAGQALRIASRKVDAGLEEQAIADLRTFIADRGDSPLLIDAYLLLAEAYEKRGRTADAMATLLEVQTRLGEDPRAADAHYRLGELTLEAGGRGRGLVARTIFTEVAKRYPYSPRAPEALARSAEIELEEKIRERDPQQGGEVPAALVTYRDLVNRYPNHPAAETALWQLGRLYEDLKLYELSAEAFSKLGERFPKTAYEAWWEAGQIFEKRLSDASRARSAYRRVPENSRNYSAAQRRLRKLG